MTVPADKPQMLSEAQKIVDRITVNFRRGLMTDEERYKAVVETWRETDDAESAVRSAVSDIPFRAPCADMKYSSTSSPSRKFDLIGY